MELTEDNVQLQAQLLGLLVEQSNAAGNAEIWDANAENLNKMANANAKKMNKMEDANAKKLQEETRLPPR